ncbi:molecular chaperone GrpE [Pseudoduganella flava]|uniref:Protein GrpE n=1 Tax=Pseudoduganella flava TaxID=871742 RepID=A0A562PWP8_9BURK|nr:nucleotide exchange factor GrpE [Pseudoduganella flava]QGZ39921.1 nucleotide exchange factor GrpE [Pseudoduganella flava]TWI48854.1 molecular chaperone GrpE [Pseudoduganella flava]
MQDQENQASPNPEEAQQPAQAASQQQAPADGAATPSLEEQLSATEAKLAEMHEAFLRAKAEGDNIRRRAQEDVAKAHKFAVESFAEALLPVRDSLEMALKVEAPTLESLKEGVEMTLKQLTSAFERNRLLEVVPNVGDKLDPNRHQAVAMVPAEQEANTVVAVLQKGYTIADRLLRPAIVTAAQPK